VKPLSVSTVRQGWLRALAKLPGPHSSQQLIELLPLFVKSVQVFSSTQAARKTLEVVSTTG
jgi:hypothetical protein